FLGKLPEPLNATAPPPSRESVESLQTIVDTPEALDRMLGRIQDSGKIAIDVETTSTEPLLAELVGIAIAVSESESFYIPVGHESGTQLGQETVRAALDPVIARHDLDVYTHHGKYDYHVLLRSGYQEHRLTFDTMIAAYVLGETSLRLKDLSFTRLGVEQTEITELIGTGKSQTTMDKVAIEKAGPYACADVELTFALAEPLRQQIEQRGQTSLLCDIELPLVSVLLDMERTGIAIDPGELSGFSEELGMRIAAIKLEVNSLAEREINLGSNRQLATLLFEDLKLASGRRTKTGFSVDSDVLESIRDQHPLVPLILEYRALSKLKSTYVDALPLSVHPHSGRVHTSYNQTVAATGRLSSVNPNLQNIPIRTELGRRVRRAFVADRRPEHRLFTDAVLIGADYSQMELRILAHMSGEDVLVDAFREGEDIHGATAALVNDVAIKDVTPDQRRIAKTVNFGIIYGMQAYGLSRDTGMSRADAQGFISAYWARLPKVKALFDTILREGEEKGYVETLLGRRRYLPDLTSANGARRQAAQRMAMNMPTQGTQADIIKMAMIRLERELRDRDVPAKMVLQVHDELVLEASDAHSDAVAALLKTTMENTFGLSVPIVAEVKKGENWDDMRPLLVV
ncbi:MAG: DNA polymerase I, partial [Chloroflexota bacterium]|nr:DNA polymerase I [Chloroflexota bacterium]